MINFNGCVQILIELFIEIAKEKLLFFEWIGAILDRKKLIDEKDGEELGSLISRAGGTCLTCYLFLYYYYYYYYYYF
jgi:hypothetical protein